MVVLLTAVTVPCFLSSPLFCSSVSEHEHKVYGWQGDLWGRKSLPHPHLTVYNIARCSRPIPIAGAFINSCRKSRSWKCLVRIFATCSPYKVIGEMHSGEIVTEDCRRGAARLLQPEQEVLYPLDFSEVSS
ncbi:hypothetical protein PIB30_071981 [Stylosanthes scabra]|uniref:Secreted protein n=1 Tax=Stylosanthes scabra TaxID=79078 RepID=A0ABU6UPK9_9FABA|nr:hypothetical protein [Stylosanthes scabra]